MLVFASFVYKTKMNTGGWFMIFNFGVHSFMYTYYALKAAKVKLPRWIPRLITTMQTLQMFIGITVITISYIWIQEPECLITKDLFFWAFLIYISYLILFFKFSYQTYIMPKVKAKTKGE